MEKTTTGGKMTRALKIVIIMIEHIATETRKGRREEKRAKTKAIGNNNNNNDNENHDNDNHDNENHENDNHDNDNHDNNNILNEKNLMTCICFELIHIGQ